METEVFCTFTSDNILLLVNDKPLGGVSSLVVKDFKEPTGAFSRINLNRVVFDGTQEVVELMRTQRFSFKLMNRTSSSGWVALDAELESYEMMLSVEDGILHQNLVVKTPSFVYAENVSAEYITAKEEEDLRNLIEILKKNQEAVKKPETGFIKYGVPPAVLPNNEVSQDWLNNIENSNEPIKGKDKKKKKKNK